MGQEIKAAKDIGWNIRVLRKQKRLTQEQLAAAMQLRGCDISRGTLAKIEVGIRHISIEELRAMKAILNVSYEDLLKEE